VRVRSVDFAGAIGLLEQSPPDGLPQVAFSGRSNVGKSSLINRVLGRTRTPLARVSATPGKTQQINFYRVRADLSTGVMTDFFLVDLPGYGYARVPKSVKQAWRPLVERYLAANDALRGVVQLIDARHDPTPADLAMVEYLAAAGRPTLFALTKIDKLRAAERPRRVAALARALGAAADQVVPCSARTGEGCRDLLDGMDALLLEAVA
jgi:GTP-binding protein